MRWPTWSSRRPGVATTISAPARSAGPGAEADAAVDGDRADRPAGAVGADALLDLEGELAGGTEDQRADGTARCGPPSSGRTGRVEALEDGQHERRRLAGARLGAGEHVAAGEHERDGLRLDGGGLGVALVRDGAEELGRQPERSKDTRMLLAGPSRTCGARSGREGGSGSAAWETGALTGAPIEHVRQECTRDAVTASRKQVAGRGPAARRAGPGSGLARDGLEVDRADLAAPPGLGADRGRGNDRSAELLDDGDLAGVEPRPEDPHALPDRQSLPAVPGCQVDRDDAGADDGRLPRRKRGCLGRRPLHRVDHLALARH